MIIKCNKCGEEKMAHPDFFRISKNKNGSWRPNAICRECDATYTREYNKTHQMWKKESVKEYKRAYDKKHFNKNKNNYLKKMHGLTLDEFNEMLKSQDGKCAICGDLSKEDERHFAVDHDHKTGENRGILCHKCNMAVGLFKDDPALFQSAITYLKSFNPVYPE